MEIMNCSQREAQSLLEPNVNPWSGLERGRVDIWESDWPRPGPHGACARCHQRAPSLHGGGCSGSDLEDHYAQTLKLVGTLPVVRVALAKIDQILSVGNDWKHGLGSLERLDIIPKNTKFISYLAVVSGTRPEVL